MLVIEKKSLKTWEHYLDNKPLFISSKFFFNTPNGNQFQIVEQGRATLDAVNIDDITLYDDSTGGGAETFATVTELSIRLEELNYTGHYNDGEIAVNTLISSDVGNNIVLGSDGNLFSAGGSAITIDATPTDGSSNAVSSNGVFDALTTKQETLVSGTNIKTINGTSVLGSGDLPITSPSNVRVANQLTDITTTSTTVVNTNLTFTIEANSVYTLDGYLYGGGSSSGGARIGLSLPIGCSGIHSVLAFNLTTTTNGNPSVVDINTQITSFAQSNNAQQTRYIATLITGANAGSVTLQFGTHTAGQGSVFRTFSHLKITKKQ